MKTLENKDLFKKLMAELTANGTDCIEYTPAQASGIADKILSDAAKLGYHKDTVTPIIPIINSFGIDVYTTDGLENGISGVIHAGGTTKKIYKTDKVIFTNNGKPLGHQRFVMAHELGHYLFDCLGNPRYRDESVLFSETYVKEMHNSEKEVRADRFAAELLMPHDLFIEQYNKATDCKMNKTHNRMFVIMYLSKYFQVKMSSIERRISEVLYNGGF